MVFVISGGKSFQLFDLTILNPSAALLEAAKINKIVISATLSFNTSGVFVILIFFFLIPLPELEDLNYRSFHQKFLPP